MSSIHVGDILEVSADALVCSANPYLNLSGGVGGAFLMKYGMEMQEYLHSFLKQQSRKVMPQGSVVEAPACGSHYKTVFHAVGVNGFYESSEQIIQNLLQQVFTRCKEMGLSSVAVPAIGTGYGNLEIQEFYNAFKASLVHANGFNVTLCLQNMDGLDSSCV